MSFDPSFLNKTGAQREDEMKARRRRRASWSKRAAGLVFVCFWFVASFFAGKKERWAEARPGPAATCFSGFGSDPFEREQASDLVRLFCSCLPSSDTAQESVRPSRILLISEAQSSTTDKAHL
jgi:hypothetical protein